MIVVAAAIVLIAVVAFALLLTDEGDRLPYYSSQLPHIYREKGER